jgi:hypothetical protein
MISEAASNGATREPRTLPPRTGKSQLNLRPGHTRARLGSRA